MELEDQQRFQVEAIGAAYGVEAATVLTCDRCQWSADIDDPISLADLNQHADEHTEVCR